MIDPFALEACSLSKRFDETSSRLRWFAKQQIPYAVEDVSFRLERGHALGVVGESGSGKTTLIRMLAGLLTPSSGDIVVSGSAVRLKSDKRARRSVQMVFQDPTESLNPSFNAERVIADPLYRLRGFKRGQATAREVRRLCDLVHLQHELLGRYPHQLSGGQKARVGIARALAAEPDVLLLDEPTTALDVSVQARVLLLLARLREELALSFVFVSHDLSVVRLLCDRVMIMRAGKVIETGTVAEVFSHPQDDYTRLLLNSIPTLAGTSPA